jgi:enoyl-CoA hydratase/carnithine racemase
VGILQSADQPDEVSTAATTWARELASGPSFAHAMTKRMLHHEWDMGIDQAIEAEAQAQAICMMTEDFKRAFVAFSSKTKPTFAGD